MLDAQSLPSLKWGAADEEGLVKFLVEEKSFSEERIRKVVEKMNASRSKATQGAHPCLSRTACFCSHCSSATHQCSSTKAADKCVF